MGKGPLCPGKQHAVVRAAAGDGFGIFTPETGYTVLREQHLGLQTLFADVQAEDLVRRLDQALGIKAAHHQFVQMLGRADQLHGKSGVEKNADVVLHRKPERPFIGGDRNRTGES